MTPTERRNVLRIAAETRCKCGLTFAECHRCNPAPRRVPEVPAVDGPRIRTHEPRTK